MSSSAIKTDLSRNLSSEDVKVIDSAEGWINHDQGTATILVGALDPKLADADMARVYLSDCQLADSAEHAGGIETAEWLWSLSEQLTDRK